MSIKYARIIEILDVQLEQSVKARLSSTLPPCSSELASLSTGGRLVFTTRYRNNENHKRSRLQWVLNVAKWLDEEAQEKI